MIESATRMKSQIVVLVLSKKRKHPLVAQRINHPRPLHVVGYDCIDSVMENSKVRFWYGFHAVCSTLLCSAVSGPSLGPLSTAEAKRTLMTGDKFPDWNLPISRSSLIDPSRALQLWRWSSCRACRIRMERCGVKIF